MEAATALDDVFCHGDDLSDNIVDDDAARSDNDPERLLLDSLRMFLGDIRRLAQPRKIMKWLLLMVVAEVNGEMTVHILSDHETMAQCHVAGTYINWSERMPMNKEMLCFPTDLDIEVIE